ncbi:2-amino-4-hydroxy-6-hydroxymethyldihydropteridine diphosphokinase [Sinorhizobium meliloti]|uniref:2-amino-4-hydroxy-6-hydroxymethyldihydropteridine pyrophosphokinase n=1 Tax=Rhizobium meliloti TaxID=382 RepID=A0A6A7ZNX1_RHIML|nr:2-amino-4-hydroxy-6-hydroxymethyldihydropteridine diphosphokinase [Sinorhizobium meliloti]MDW9376053.1 2-amino-4-hydroxy-6-hydroxymethyldihydropteridine diphosphokinase [Sinorhizobium meliloti]MDW9494856.1 2-amino-4-hydroxy-6-hydroxymethyldihydropteridine diphosphokinase [Sinorhizobium meliloti]MDW9562911.1 2-amino-4-hydroxy-6-hydroxymethyldihydropteridine diphosphokinase [Sinorhizobium meliloti]MDW9650251.1 2-amino-4-hydroxy-6-hydroxymethyldihydropteridine diphosphokinase [Sinorhizobium mel
MSPNRSWRHAILGLGGNLGDPRRSMAEALRALDARSDCRVVAVSRLYRTPPWGKTDQDWFVNACAEVETTLDPEALLAACLDIERAMKRVRMERWGPRTIDIDLLTFGDLNRASATLTLPHPRMTERGFVLKPLADFAADLAVEGRTVIEWLGRADVTGIEVADESVEWWRAEE